MANSTTNSVVTCPRCNQPAEYMGTTRYVDKGQFHDDTPWYICRSGCKDRAWWEDSDSRLEFVIFEGEKRLTRPECPQ